MYIYIYIYIYFQTLWDINMLSFKASCSCMGDFLWFTLFWNIKKGKTKHILDSDSRFETNAFLGIFKYKKAKIPFVISLVFLIPKLTQTTTKFEQIFLKNWCIESFILTKCTWKGGLQQLTKIPWIKFFRVNNIFALLYLTESVRMESLQKFYINIDGNERGARLYSSSLGLDTIKRL